MNRTYAKKHELLAGYWISGSSPDDGAASPDGSALTACAHVRSAMLRFRTAATIALLLSLPGVPNTFTAARVEAVAPKTTAHRARGALGNEPRGATERATDRVIARRVRAAIRRDPFLTLATSVVKVTSKRGIVRLVGRVRGDKERSSIAFKAEQIVGVEAIDDRVTIGDGVE